MLARPHEIQAHWVILDVGARLRYLEAHIPGARFVDYADLVAPTPQALGACPTPEILQALYQSWGLSASDTVLVYDDALGCSAGRLFWTLTLCGQADIRYLAGGFGAWLAAGRPTEQATPSYAPSQTRMHFDPTALITYEQARAALTDPDTVFWDARSPAEYQGTQSHAALAGHIPGARNYPWSRALQGADLLPLEVIRAELAACGITPDKQVISYCHSHHRSAFCYMLGRLLGFPRMRGYAGSWSEWGNKIDSPVERVEC